MKTCKHPIKDISYRWVNKSGSPISFKGGSNGVKKEFTCLACGKTFIHVPKKIRDAEIEEGEILEYLLHGNVK